MKKKSTKSTTITGRRKATARKSGTKRLARNKRPSGHKIVDSIIDYFTRHPREVVNYKAVAASLGFTTMSEKQFVVRTLESLVEQGMLTQVEIGRYRYQVGAEMLEGVFESRRNYCVVVPDDESAEVIISDRNNPEHAPYSHGPGSGGFAAPPLYLCGARCGYERFCLSAYRRSCPR